MCYQAVLRLEISLTEMFYNSICLRLMEIYDESASMVTSAVFITRQNVASTMVF